MFVYAAFRNSRCFARGIALCGIVFVTRASSAQAPASRYWLNGGIGYGQSGPAQSNGVDQYRGTSADVAGGWTLSSRGLLGIEAALWHHDTPIGSSRTDFIVATIQAHPFGSVLDNLYFQGGIGLGSASLPTFQTTGNVSSRLTVTKLALQVGVGVDLPVSCPLWVTPFFQSYGTVGGRRLSQPTPGQQSFANAILFHAGAALKYVHPGPRGACTQRSSVMPK